MPRQKPVTFGAGRMLRGVQWKLLPLHEGDATRILALIRMAFSALEVPLHPPPTALEETTQSIAHQIAVGGGACIEVGGVPVGCILWVEKSGLYLRRLAVLPQWRRNGIALRLIYAAEDEARRRDLRRIHLETRLVLEGNLRLFTRCGFTEFAQAGDLCHSMTTLTMWEKWLPEQ
jgi:GNAT superfamily N-acetyltransferase